MTTPTTTRKICAFFITGLDRSHLTNLDRSGFEKESNQDNNLEATHAVTLGAALRVLLFVASDTDHVLVTRYETPVADWLSTFLAAETLLVPLLTHVLKLLHS